MTDRAMLKAIEVLSEKIKELEMYKYLYDKMIEEKEEKKESND